MECVALPKGGALMVICDRIVDGKRQPHMAVREQYVRFTRERTAKASTSMPLRGPWCRACWMLSLESWQVRAMTFDEMGVATIDDAARAKAISKNNRDTWHDRDGFHERGDNDPLLTLRALTEAKERARAKVDLADSDARLTWGHVVAMALVSGDTDAEAWPAESAYQHADERIGHTRREATAVFIDLLEDTEVEYLDDVHMALDAAVLQGWAGWVERDEVPGPLGGRVPRLRVAIMSTDGKATLRDGDAVYTSGEERDTYGRFTGVVPNDSPHSGVHAQTIEGFDALIREYRTAIVNQQAALSQNLFDLPSESAPAKPTRMTRSIQVRPSTPRIVVTPNGDTPAAVEAAKAAQAIVDANPQWSQAIGASFVESQLQAHSGEAPNVWMMTPRGLGKTLAGIAGAEAAAAHLLGEVSDPYTEQQRVEEAIAKLGAPHAEYLGIPVYADDTMPDDVIVLGRSSGPPQTRRGRRRKR